MPECTLEVSPKLQELTHLMPAESSKSDHEEHCLARREELREEHHGTFVSSIHSSLVSIKPLLCSPQERERKQTEPDCILRYTLDNKSTAELQELLEMSTGILLAWPQKGLACTIVIRPILISKFSLQVLTSGPVGTLLADGAE